jgi:hypothetical protein
VVSDAQARELRDLALNVMTPFLQRLMAKRECIGVGLLSSTAEVPSRACQFSQQSDFDVSVLIDVPMKGEEWCPDAHETYELLQDRLPAWLPNFLFYVEVPWGQMEVNVHQLVYPYELDDRTVWDDDKSDAYAHKLQLIYDPAGHFRHLVDRKASARRGKDREIARLANRLTWDVSYGPLKQAARHGSLTGHYMLNVAIEELLDLLYVRDSLPVPNKKWKIAGLEAAGIFGPDQLELLGQAIECCPGDPTDLLRRARALDLLARSIGALVDSDDWVLATRRKFQKYLEPRHLTMAERAALLASASEASERLRNAINFALPGNAEELARQAAAGHDGPADQDLLALAQALLTKGE